MKRKLLYVATFATGMLLTACSNDDNLLDGAKENGLGAVFNEQGNAFFSVNINRPDVAVGSRAAGDDGPGMEDRNFNDGNENEYNIENATLLLFGQKEDMTSERDYELISYYNLAPEDWTKEGTGAQVTQTRTSVVKVSKTNTEGYNGLWALVLANKMNYVTIDGDEDKPVIKYRNKDTGTYTEYATLSVAEGKKITYGDIADLQIVERHRNYKTSAFFMSNMPYTTAVPTSANTAHTLTVHNLYKVDVAKLYTSKETAQEKESAATINIERSLAKIEVVKSSSFVPKTEVEKLDADVKGWFVDNTNKSTSLMRKCYEDADANPSFAYLNYKTHITDPTPALWSSYRFVSSNFVYENCYRTFWAIDHNYNKNAEEDLISKKNTVASLDMMKFDVEGNVLSGSLRELGSCYYCTENTFDVEHQTEPNTTRVVVAAVFNGGEDFYTVSTKENMIYTATTAPNPVMTAAEHLQDYIKDEVVKRSINQAWAEYYLANSAKLKECLEVAFEYTNATDASKSTPTAGKLMAKITLNKAALASNMKPEYEVSAAVTHWPSDNNETLNGTSYVYNYYKDGAAFYSIKIKHFGDTETPWKGIVGMHNTVASNYGVGGNPDNSAQNYLGRYGVVRNSWYNITVTGIRQIGSPTVPDTPNIPDDTVEQYLKYTINVTPWRVYKQEEKLQ